MFFNQFISFAWLLQGSCHPLWPSHWLSCARLTVQLKFSSRPRIQTGTKSFFPWPCHALHRSPSAAVRYIAKHFIFKAYLQCNMHVCEIVRSISKDLYGVIAIKHCSLHFGSLIFHNMTDWLCHKGDGVLVWTPSSIQPVNLTIQVSDQTSSSLITPVLRLCNCMNGGSCQYNSVAENLLLGKFQVSHNRNITQTVVSSAAKKLALCDCTTSWECSWTKKGSKL